MGQFSEHSVHFLFHMAQCFLIRLFSCISNSSIQIEFRFKWANIRFHHRNEMTTQDIYTRYPKKNRNKKYTYSRLVDTLSKSSTSFDKTYTNLLNSCPFCVELSFVYMPWSDSRSQHIFRYATNIYLDI